MSRNRKTNLGIVVVVLALIMVVPMWQHYNSAVVARQEARTLENAQVVFAAAESYIELCDGECPRFVGDFISFLPDGRRLSNPYPGQEMSEPRNLDDTISSGVIAAGGVYYRALSDSTFEVIAYGAKVDNGPLIKLSNQL